MRHCAVHHSFHAENIRSTWLIMKGNNSNEKRVKSVTSEKAAPIGKSAFETIEKAFGAVLTIHPILCDWSSEDWRWYIESLEQRLEKLTVESITTNADVPLSMVNPSDTNELHGSDAPNTIQKKFSSYSFLFFIHPGPKPDLRELTYDTNRARTTGLDLSKPKCKKTAHASRTEGRYTSNAELTVN